MNTRAVCPANARHRQAPNCTRSLLSRCGGALLAALLALPGCSDDNRISVDQMRELEQQALAAASADDLQSVDARNLSLTEIKRYRLAQGDVVSLSIIGAEGPFSKSDLRVRIHADGNIYLPLVGPIHAEGMTLAELEKAVIDAHVPKFVKDLSVFAELTGPEKTTVVVMGDTLTPGLVTLGSNERNALYALSRAGGFQPTASGIVRLRPVDPQREEVVYNLHRTDDLRRILLAPPLESGDSLVVDRAPANAIYLTGLVNAPGPQSLPANTSLSVMRAISAAGGLVDFLEPEEATLWHKLPNGEQVRVKVDIGAIATGEAPDLALVPGDILDIPHTPETRFRQWVSQNIRIGPFGVSTVWDPVAEWRFQRALDEQRRNNQNFGNSVLDTVLYQLPNIVVPPVAPPVN